MPRERPAEARAIPAHTPPPAVHSATHGASASIVSPNNWNKCQLRGAGELRGREYRGSATASTIGAAITSQPPHSSARASGEILGPADHRRRLQTIPAEQQPDEREQPPA